MEVVAFLMLSNFYLNLLNISYDVAADNKSTEIHLSR